MNRSLGRGASVLLAVVALAIAPTGVQAGVFRPGKSVPARIESGRYDEIQRALDEGRLLDVGELIDKLALSGSKEPRLKLFAGELGLARGSYEAALGAFRAVRDEPSLQSEALQGEALALAQLGRPGEALPLLKQVVAREPAAWRAWNTLGAEYDNIGAWSDAEDAYAHALATAPRPALPLNNRGYSRLLQGRLDEAVTDFVAALGKQPDLAAARSNLRLALALRGEYDRAIDGATGSDRAASLNNAGLAAGARGDFSKAEDMLQRAIAAKGAFYQRAADNLVLVHELARRTKDGDNVHH